MMKSQFSQINFLGFSALVWKARELLLRGVKTSQAPHLQSHMNSLKGWDLENFQA